MSDCTMTDMKHVFPRLTSPLRPMVLAAALGRVGDSDDSPFLFLCFFSRATSSCVGLQGLKPEDDDLVGECEELAAAATVSIFSDVVKIMAAIRQQLQFTTHEPTPNVKLREHCSCQRTLS